MTENIRDRFLNQGRRTGNFTSFPNFNKVGDEKLLPTAHEELEKILRAAGWEITELRPITTKQLNAVQALRFMISDKVRSWILPLCAKKYPISRPDTGALWFSVSEVVINAAHQYGDNVVLTYLSQLGKIYATHAGAAEPDNFGGDYLRFNERYYGWNLKAAISLDKWMKDPSSLTVQERLLP
ncbi:MAG TPA: hypothetical protein VGS11_10935 [Candidatus Bathyarchaeia archaeon]|nr:hypothetical protein [Candidatus Bathyarchaeia archaeon]